MQNIKIGVTNKRAAVIGSPVLVCNNTGDTITFIFDEEWEGRELKTARFAYTKSGKAMQQEVPFIGDTVGIPLLSGISEVLVGVYAGELITTTPARVSCAPSILCGTGEHEEPEPDVYRELLELIQKNLIDPSTEVDSEMSDTSTNPVQNKVTKAYIDEQLKDVKIPVDETLDENSTNAIQNAVVAKEIQDVKNIIDENEKRWLTLSFEDFSAQAKGRLGVSMGTIIGNEEQPDYALRVRFYMWPFKSSSTGLIDVMGLPFEVVEEKEMQWVNWLNPDEFLALGIIHPQLGSRPFNLIDELESMVDGTIFYKAEHSMSFTGYTVGYYDFVCELRIYSHLREAIDTLSSELAPMLTTATHFCLLYQNNEVVELNPKTE